MLISAAYASSGAAPATAAASSASAEAFGLNMLLILIMIVLFYVLLIMPQQKRYKEHKAMVESLKKGDKILTAGGFIATVDHMVEGKDEVVVDLGNGMKVTALRSTIQMRVDAQQQEKKAS